MSIIQCPECNNDISDQAIACPNCGYPLNTNEKCDSTNKQNQQYHAQRNVYGKIIVVFFIFIALIATLFSAYYFISKQKERVSIEHYNHNLNLVLEETYSCAVEAEEIVVLVANTWRSFILTQKDAGTDKYTRKNNGQGSFYSDINTVLNNIFEDQEITSKIKKITDSKASVSNILTTMKNPPKNYQDIHQDLLNNYTALCSLLDFSIQIQAGTHEMYLKSMNEKIEKYVETRRIVLVQVDQ